MIIKIYVCIKNKHMYVIKTNILEHISKNRLSMSEEKKITQITFKHIYNGLIIGENGIFPMIEFKIEMPKESKEQALFKYVDFKCAWFMIDVNETYKQLIGPIKIDVEKIKTGNRVINDAEFPDLNGLDIESISNVPEDLIADDDIPDWMLVKLTSLVHLPK